jgi:hypothetical protein
MASEQQRRELAEFLRNRRERRSPADLGLPAGGRRRTPGLRREEVAAIAGLSVTWYTWLEQAREIRVSRQVLSSLVDVLGLDGVETAHLFRLAGEVPPQESALARDELAPQYELLLAQLDPSPAFIVNRRLDILAWNRGCGVLYSELPHLPTMRRNILWLTFMSADIRKMSDSWEEDAAQTVALFRAQSGEGVLAPEVVALIEDVQAASPEFRRLWQRRDLATFTPTSRKMHHPKLGPVELEYIKMHAAGDDITLVAYIAAPGSDLARQLAALIAADAG